MNQPSEPKDPLTIDDATNTPGQSGRTTVTVFEASEEREFVQVVRFGVADEDQAKLIQVISDEVERWVRACPGFIACHMHASVDGKYVLNYARWQSESAFHDFTKHPETDTLNSAIRDIGTTSGPEPATYRLMREILPTTPDVKYGPSVMLATS
jgi:C-6 monooxygenase